MFRDMVYTRKLEIPVFVRGNYVGRIDEAFQYKDIEYQTEFIGPLLKYKRRPVCKYNMRVRGPSKYQLRVNINKNVFFNNLSAVETELRALFPIGTIKIGE